MPKLCRHGCAGWCAACDFAAAYPDGDPLPIFQGLPGRARVMCPNCPHTLASHVDGLCRVEACACGLPGGSGHRIKFRDRIRSIASLLELERPDPAVAARMLDRALDIHEGGW
jgi:hypothetical protein